MGYEHTKKIGTVDEDAHIRISIILEDIIKQKDSSFANARTVRNIFETLITNQAC